MEEGEEIVPTMNVSERMTKRDFGLYFDSLVKCISRFMIMDKREFRIMKLGKKINGKIRDEEYLIFLPAMYKGIACNVILLRGDVYLVGFEVRGKCCLFSEDTNYSTDHMENVRNCLRSLGKGNMEVFEVGESYSCLERLAEIKRSQLVLGRESLVNVFDYFVGHDIKKEKLLGVSLLTLTQMVCEPLRFWAIAFFVHKNFESGCIIPEKLVIIEHMWSVASRILQKGPNVPFELYIFDESEDPLTYGQLYNTIGILKNFEGIKLHGNKMEEFDKVIVAKYLHASYGKYFKKLEVKDVGSICEVKVMVHMLDNHVVLQYNHNNILKNVSVNVTPPESFEISVFQLGQKISTCKTFVSFIQNSNVFFTRFASILTGIAKDGLAVEVPLDDINLLAKDYFRGAGVSKNFEDPWQKISKYKVTSKKYLRQKMSMEEAKGVASELFNIKDVTNRGTRNQQRDPLKTLFHGKYNNNSSVLVKVRYQVRDERVFMIKISARCEDPTCLGVIIALLEEWEFKYCIII